MPLGVEGRLYTVNANAADADVLLVCYLLCGCCHFVVLSSHNSDAWYALCNFFIAPSMVPASHVT